MIQVSKDKDKVVATEEVATEGTLDLSDEMAFLEAMMEDDDQEEYVDEKGDDIDE